MSLRKCIRDILHSTVEGAGQWVLFTALVVSENELRAGILGIWHSTWEAESGGIYGSDCTVNGLREEFWRFYVLWAYGKIYVICDSADAVENGKAYTLGE